MMNINIKDKFKGKPKKVVGMFLCTIISIALIGCSGASNTELATKTPSQESPSEETTPPTNITIDVRALAKEIYEVGEYTDELTELEEDMFDAVFQTVDLEMVSAKAAYVGSAATAEQIVVVEVKDEAKAAQVRDALSQKLKDDISMNENYLPQEINKLENPVLVISGKYVILSVSNDNDKVEQILLKKGIMS